MCNDMILAENTYLEAGFKKNMNCLVLGVPGSGKTRGHILPNLCQMEDSSAVLLDPKGELYSLTANMMRQRGFTVKLVDFDNPNNPETEFYNPLKYCSNSEDVITITRLLLSEGFDRSVDPFWPKSAQILANALMGYLIEAVNDNDATLRGLTTLIKNIEFSTAPGEKHTLELMFDELKEKNRRSWAAEQFELIKKSALSERTYSSIVITLVAAFSGCMTDGIKRLTDRDTLDIPSIGKTKTVVYIKSSDSDRSKDTLISILFQQIFNILFREADKNTNHALDVHTHLFLDDLGTNLTIENLDCMLAACRSREISCSIILQSVGQLQKQYGHAYTAILGSCASLVFLGSNDIDTCREMSYRLNKPWSTVLYKDTNDIFVFTQGKQPIKTRVYNVKNHINYSLMEDFQTTVYQSTKSTSSKTNMQR